MIKQFTNALAKLSEAIAHVRYERLAVRLDVEGSGESIDLWNGRHSVDGAPDYLGRQDMPKGVEPYDCVTALLDSYDLHYGGSEDPPGYREVYRTNETDSECPWCGDDAPEDMPEVDECLLCEGCGTLDCGGYAVYAPIKCAGCNEWQHSCECSRYVYQLSDAGCYGDGTHGQGHVRSRLADQCRALADLMDQPDPKFWNAKRDIDNLRKIVDYLAEPMSDDASEEDWAIDVLNEYSVPMLIWGFVDGDLMAYQTCPDSPDSDCVGIDPATECKACGGQHETSHAS